MGSLVGGGQSAARTQAVRDRASAQGTALAQLLAREAELDKENAGASTRRQRGKRLLTNLTDDQGNAVLG